MQKWAIIGLGNPGAKFEHTRHNIGFRVLDALAKRLFVSAWQSKNESNVAQVQLSNILCYLVKPTTFMNDSGKVIPYLLSQGVVPERIIVVHDELELPFGKHKQKFGGSARGHNGLRSIIAVIGKDFYRIACGIDRPESREDVAQYVLERFSEPVNEVEQMIDLAVQDVITCIEREAEQ